MTASMPLIVTRPEPGCSATVAAARAMGLNAYGVPLFAARALDWVPPDPANFDALLLTSAQAIRLAGPGLARFAALPVYAVGAATAAAAKAAGFAVAMTGTRRAQALLDAMTSSKKRRILWLCGRDRSALMPQEASMTALPCYAVDPIDPPDQWQELIAAPAVIMVHSARGAARVAALSEGHRAHLSLVAVSREAATAGDGWAFVAIAERPDIPAMLARAAALCHKGQK